MKPYCPVCKKRVEPASYTGKQYGCFVTCSDCGIGFDPYISERLAPKCSCGADLESRNCDPGFFRVVGPEPKCAKCRKEGK